MKRGFAKAEVQLCLSKRCSDGEGSEYYTAV